MKNKMFKILKEGQLFYGNIGFIKKQINIFKKYKYLHYNSKIFGKN